MTTTAPTIIVGAGPTGLALAWLLAQYQRHCIVIDENDSAGGCHRVARTESGLFTEVRVP